MGLGILKKLKKNEKLKTKKRQIKNLVVGNDLFSLKMYEFLKKECREDVYILSGNEITSNELRFYGPSLLRGAENIDQFKNLWPDLNSVISDSKSFFYKENRFREFGGRSKSEKLLDGEQFYTQSGMTFPEDEFFSFLNEKNYIDLLNQEQLYLEVESIKKAELIELKCTNGDIICCEKLFWGNDPKHFLELYERKNDLLCSSIVKCCDSSNSTCSLFVKFVFDRKIFDTGKTIFLPLSATHDMGHFIGDFKSFENEEKQEIEFVHLIDKNDSSEDEIAKKMKILRRNIEKIFPESNDAKIEEYITLCEKNINQKINDEQYQTIWNDEEQIFFVGMNAPLRTVSPEISHLVRGLLSVEQFTGELL